MPILSIPQFCGRQLVVAVTGGGSQAIADLLTVPGASATVLEAVVPYSLRRSKTGSAAASIMLAANGRPGRWRWRRSSGLANFLS